MHNVIITKTIMSVIIHGYRFTCELPRAISASCVMRTWRWHVYVYIWIAPNIKRTINEIKCTSFAFPLLARDHLSSCKLNDTHVFGIFNNSRVPNNWSFSFFHLSVPLSLWRESDILTFSVFPHFSTLIIVCDNRHVCQLSLKSFYRKKLLQSLTSQRLRRTSSRQRLRNIIMT